jgi:IS30 family transposase
LVEGGGESALKVSVERKTRLTKVRQAKNKMSSQSNKSLVDMLKDIPRDFVKTITYDNGRKNSEHVEINCILGTKSYFCQAYHCCQKGTVENTNGIIRHFFPKETNFNSVSDDEIAKVESWLNNRSRKCLDYFTPQEVLNSTVVLASWIRKLLKE